MSLFTAIQLQFGTTFAIWEVICFAIGQTAIITVVCWFVGIRIGRAIERRWP
jgi:hypothetical protein